MRSELAWALLTARALQYDKTPGGFARMTQADAAALLGWLVLRCTPSKLRTQGLALLQRAVNARMP